MLNSASRIFIIGNGRAHAVATNFIYELNHVDKQIFLISGTRFMFREELSNVVRGDLLIANSSGPYSSNTCEMAATVTNKGVIMLSITDSAVSPLVNISQLSFVVHEARTDAFRSLSASLVLAQMLTIALADLTMVNS